MGNGRRALMVVVLLATSACAQATGARESTGCAEAFVATLSIPLPDQPSSDHVAYSSDIVLLNKNLQPGRQLTDDGRSGYPDFSPDGERIAFESFRGYEPAGDFDVGLSSIWVIGEDGQGEEQLTRGYGDRFPRWSPDGERIVFLRWDGDSYQPQILDVDGGTTTALDAPVYDRLDWISDDVLAGVAQDEQDYTTYLFQVDVVTGEVQRIDSGVDDVGGEVLWSPDGAEFAYVRHVDYRQPYDRSARPTIQIHELETGEERTVPGSDTLENRLILWTSDGSLIFWQNTRRAGYNIALSADGGRAAERVIGTHRDGQAVSDPYSDNPVCAP